MAKKRLRKKKEKSRLQRELTGSGYTRKELKNKSYKSIQSIAEHERQKEEIRKQEQKKEEKRQKQREYRKNSRLKKKKALEKAGIDPFQFSLSQIDKIKLKDLKQNNFNRTTYPHFFKDDMSSVGVRVPGDFDFEKKYKLKNGDVMYFAFRDYACETDFEDLIKFHQTLSNEDLLNRLWKIATLRPTFNKDTQRATKGNSGTSSGSAGDFKYICSSYAVYMHAYNESYNRNRRKATREHTGTHKGYQTLKNGSKNTFDTVSPRGLLIIANSLMYNITEWERVSFYKEFYFDVKKHIPEFGELLPYPLEND